MKYKYTLSDVLLGVMVGMFIMGAILNYVPSNNVFGSLDGYCYEVNK